MNKLNDELFTPEEEKELKKVGIMWTYTADGKKDIRVINCPNCNKFISAESKSKKIKCLNCGETYRKINE